MPSEALQLWSTRRQAALDELEAAHAALGETGRFPRSTSRYVNEAYTVLLASHFQGFCRDLHSEAADHLSRVVRPASLQVIFRSRLTLGRKLDRGNPNPGNLGADFGRFGLDFWTAVRGSDRRNSRRQEALSELAEWRNAIAHQDFPPARFSESLRLARIRRWRSVCHQLAASFDTVLGAHLAEMTGQPPW